MSSIDFLVQGIIRAFELIFSLNPYILSITGVSIKVSGTATILATFNGDEYSIHKKNSIMARMSMLFQKPALFNTSVFNNVGYGLSIRGENKNKIEKKVSDALNLVGLADYEKQKALTLSGG